MEILHPFNPSRCVTNPTEPKRSLHGVIHDSGPESMCLMQEGRQDARGDVGSGIPPSLPLTEPLNDLSP